MNSKQLKKTQEIKKVINEMKEAAPSDKDLRYLGILENINQILEELVKE